MIDFETVDRIILNALSEDIGNGDITTIATIKKEMTAAATLLIKQDGIIAGLSIAERVFNLVDKSLQFTRKIDDGSRVKYGDVAAVIVGNAASILTAERTALNFLQRMSGIATYADTFVDAVKHTKAKIIDTRKTAPGLRYLDKLAVKLAGCKNHRIGLYDMFLIKDNHIEVAGSITNAVNACKEYNLKNKGNHLIEVEVKNLTETEEAIKCKTDVIMLDNFQLDVMKKAVKLINGKCKVEASGGVTLETVKQIAETGVDYISIGALTHSVKALDISLNVTM
ncbi:MAG TPA: carboxylating nicotinate-nucleotide diphosphorylase [Ignavibacteriaceae bacterium]|nr:carboxylating nicotinate-nucleotide diphosphorylase [Ignavibacteriaceae bacterium]